ncbi:hypothetical protein N7456_001723 [Penicillium angulare]|uniref:Major facilitator superfamily (MFS) profile domain-containing protein n=1 Tax=Penicillium angulare TaxID=116970 RepID=A0A9W9KND4_9EURO|nr:hypothetical protein N7456_001723 [Penicillium angulare]
MGGFLDSIPFQNTFPSIATTTGSSTLQGFTVAVYEIGCAFGALTVIFGGDRFGRRTTVIYGQIILIIGAILQFTSYSLAQLIVGRIVTGVGNGMAVAVLPTWNGECSRPTSRGRAVMWQLNVNIFGVALAYWVDFGLNESSLTGNTDWSWRFPLSLQVLFSALTIFLASFIPDSPRALVKQGRMEEARDVIDMLSLEADASKREDATNVHMSVIETILAEEAESNSSWSDITTQGRPKFFQRLVLAVLSLSMMQLSGINLITYYAPTIFQNSLNMSHRMSLLLSGFNGLEYWLATFIPIPLIDRLGRRPILLFSAIGQTISMAVLAGSTAYPDSTSAGVIAAVFLFVFNTFFGIGFDGIPFLLPVELTPLQTRGKSVSIATGCFWLCNFFVVMISPVLISRIQWGTYVLWCGTNLSFIPIIYFLIPETLNGTLEDISVMFEESGDSWVIGPSSRAKLAQIIANREAAEAERVDGEKDMLRATAETIEDSKFA